MDPTRLISVVPVEFAAKSSFFRSDRRTQDHELGVSTILLSGSLLRSYSHQRELPIGRPSSQSMFRCRRLLRIALHPPRLARRRTIPLQKFPRPCYRQLRLYRRRGSAGITRSNACSSSSLRRTLWPCSRRRQAGSSDMLHPPPRRRELTPRLDVDDADLLRRSRVS